MLAKDFILAGSAIFTVCVDADPSGGSPTHRTYRVRHVEFKDRACYFTYLLTGPDNTSDYSYLGILDAETGKIRPTAKSRARVTETRAWKVLEGAIRLIWGGLEVEGVEIAHAGKCGRCGRLLTDPRSIEAGIGPVCREAML